MENFNKWLTDQLEKFELDTEVYVEYFNGILSDENLPLEERVQNVIDIIQSATDDEQIDFKTFESDLHTKYTESHLNISKEKQKILMEQENIRLQNIEEEKSMVIKALENKKKETENRKITKEECIRQRMIEEYELSECNVDEEGNYVLKEKNNECNKLETGIGENNNKSRSKQVQQFAREKAKKLHEEKVKREKDLLMKDKLRKDRSNKKTYKKEKQRGCGSNDSIHSLQLKKNIQYIHAKSFIQLKKVNIIKLSLHKYCTYQNNLLYDVSNCHKNEKENIFLYTDNDNIMNITTNFSGFSSKSRKDFLDFNENDNNSCQDYDIPLLGADNDALYKDDDTSSIKSIKLHDMHEKDIENITYKREEKETDLNMFYSTNEFEYFKPNFGRELFLEALSDVTLYRSNILEKKAEMTQDYGNFNDCQIIKEGWLLKRRSLMKSWKRRWCVLYKSLAGPCLSYFKDCQKKALKKTILLSSTSSCFLLPQAKRSKNDLFRLIVSIDLRQRDYIFSSHTRLNSICWMAAINGIVKESTYELIDKDLHQLFKEAGMNAFLVRFGIRQLHRKSTQIQTRVLELNFVENIVSISKRGETMVTFAFSSISVADSLDRNNQNSRHGITLVLRCVTAIKPSLFNNRSLEKRKSNGECETNYSFFLNTIEARDDLLTLFNQIMKQTIDEQILKQRWKSKLTLKTGMFQRRNISGEESTVGINATIKGKLTVLLNEYQLQIYPYLTSRRNPQKTYHRNRSETDVVSTSYVEAINLREIFNHMTSFFTLRRNNFHHEDMRRPWFIIELPGIRIDVKAYKKLIKLGKYSFICENSVECNKWFSAIKLAKSISPYIVQNEMRLRNLIKSTLISTVQRLKKLLSADVMQADTENNRLSECNNSDNSITMFFFMRLLWLIIFPDEAWTGNDSLKWLEIGFQRGGPACDFRSTGLLGLQCLVYFVKTKFDIFSRIIRNQTITNKEIVHSRFLNYPVAVAAINVVALLAEIIGIGNAGSPTTVKGPLKAAAKTFSTLVANSIPEGHTTFDNVQGNITQSRNSIEKSKICLTDPTIEKGKSPLDDQNLLGRWEIYIQGFQNVVFEEIFCIFFPLLDRIFIEMNAGYMEFGQVLDTLRDRMEILFSFCPQTISELQLLVESPNIDTFSKTKIISE